jgi:hypothetical protein
VLFSLSNAFRLCPANEQMRACKGGPEQAGKG